MRAAGVGMLTDPISSEGHLQVFVERKLDGDVGQSQKGGRQTGIE